jgi:hypothetical protein
VGDLEMVHESFCLLPFPSYLLPNLKQEREISASIINYQ